MAFTPVTSMQRLTLPDPIGIDQLKRRNALAERDQVNQDQNALNYQRQIDAQLAGQDYNRAQNEQKAAQEEQKQALTEAVSLAQFARRATDPNQKRALTMRLGQNPVIAQLLQEEGVGPEAIQDSDLDELIAITSSQMGQGPQTPYTISTQQGPNGSSIVTDGSRFQVVEPPKPVGAGQAYRTLTPAEVAAAGLPPGTSAQQGPDGKIDVLSKRDNTGVLSQKDASTAKMKLNTVALARQQLGKIKEAFEEGRKGFGPNAFGGAQGWLPTQAGKKFDARVDQMRSTLTALTRVPGVGAMSDYETKLDQAKFPSRTSYESVTADTLQNLDDQLSLIESGYRGLLSAGQQPESAPQTAPQASGPVRVSTPAEAAKLPAGTRFITPDGQERIKR